MSGQDQWVQLGARLRARESGHAHRVAHIAVWPPHDQARILIPVAMPGEPSRLWAVAWGEPGSAPQVRAVATPMDNYEQLKLWQWLTDLVWPWASTEADKGQCTAQLVMASSEATGVMQSAADRLLRYDVNRSHAEGEPDLRAISNCAQLLWWAISEQARIGSHLVVPMQEVLDTHWAFGGLCNNLSDQLAWIRGTPPQEPGSPWEDLWPPEQDEKGEYLLELVKRWRAKKHQPEDGEAIKVVLEETASTIWYRVQDAWMTYRDAGLAPLPSLDHWCRLDANGWLATRTWLDQGGMIAIHDSQSSGIIRFNRRNSAQGKWDHELLCADPWKRLLATARGEVVEGQAVCSIPGTWTLITDQLNVRLRQGDLVHRLADLKRNYTVRAVHLRNNQHHIELQGNTAGLAEFEILVPRQPVDSTGQVADMAAWATDRRVPIPAYSSKQPPNDLMQRLAAARRQ